MTIETVCLFSAGVALAILGSGLPSVSSGAGTLAVGLAMLLLLLVTRIASLVAALSLVTRARAPALGVEVAIGAVAVPAMLDALVGLIEALRPLLPGPFVLVMAVAAGIALVVGAVFAIGARDCGWRIAAIATSLIGLAVLGACEGAKTSLMFVLLWLGPVPAFLAASSIAGRVDRGGLAITPQALTAQIDAIRLLLAAACLAIIGLPPFAGFWARLILVQAAWSHADYAVVAATLISSLILCYALARRSFEPVTAAADDSRLASVRRVAASELLVLGVMSGLSLAGGLYPAPFIEISQMARGSSPQHHLELTEHP